MMVKATLPAAKRLNLGCGNHILPGFVNLDISPGPGVDVAHDLSKFPYPFKDGEFGFILASHVLEHLDDTIGVMGELHRILRPGGVLVLRFPYYLHPNAWVDPTHKKCLTEDTIRYFTADFERTKRIIDGRYTHNPVAGRSVFRKMTYAYKPTWVGYLVYPFIRWLRHFCAILVLEVEVRLVK
jgi:SAM-dependent methyltransferase